MAEETLDAAVERLALSAGPCKTVGLMLDGAKGWTPTFYIRLVQDYGLEKEVSTRMLTSSMSLTEQLVVIQIQNQSVHDDVTSVPRRMFWYFRFCGSSC